MDEFDEFDAPGEGDFGDAELGDEDPSAALDEFDEFDDGSVPGEAELEAFDFEPEPEFADGLDDAFDFGEATDSESESESDETAYASTYEDMLVADADNPAAFPPELDLDVPEPVDGYPWVDLDVLGRAEAEPWVNTAESSDFAAADVDDVASEALSRFWER
ncbi:hypothetical protein L0U85_05430 [Glycomyces sp. L485]|uniref:hypothetical protein n=1 Tax=Glycomyces sp. L485 TaxID=2909235 RepID=UPI001F4A33B1|nr:hypothetical protein [Glycomyces sp. L485]MCH7230299.1 hypothetical protein [Glycomyces sp. L485]